VFVVSELRFAVAGKQIGNGCASLGFDDIIDIDEIPAQTAGEERTDGALARAHEAGEDDAARLRAELVFGLGLI
jgi:hypothetical protein